MSSRLRTVEHIVVFDRYDEMVAGKKEEPFWYMYQKEVYFGDKKINERHYNSRPKKIGMPSNQLERLKKKVDRMLTKPFCWVDVAESPEWVDVNIKGGSTISYMGDHRDKFLQKVIGCKKTEEK